MSSEGFDTFGFGQNDETVQAGRTRFKIEKDRAYRLSMAYWPKNDKGLPNLDAPTPIFKGQRRLYVQGIGYFLDKGPEFVKLAGQASKMCVATVVVQWPIDGKGNPDKALLAAGDFKVMPWTMDPGKYRNLESIHNEFPFGTCDLKVLGVDSNFQKMTFSPCRESVFRKLLENPKAKAIVDRILGEVNEIAESLGKEIANDWTLDQVRQKLAGGSPGGGGGGAPAGPVEAASDEAMDDIVDDLLDGDD